MLNPFKSISSNTLALITICEFFEVGGIGWTKVVQRSEMPRKAL